MKRCIRYTCLLYKLPFLISTNYAGGTSRACLKGGKEAGRNREEGRGGRKKGKEKKGGTENKIENKIYIFFVKLSFFFFVFCFFVLKISDLIFRKRFEAASSPRKKRTPICNMCYFLFACPSTSSPHDRASCAVRTSLPHNTKSIPTPSLVRLIDT